jgi:hypothetical protein
MAVEKPKGCKSPGIDQIPAELIKTGSRKIRFQIHTLINVLKPSGNFTYHQI